MFNNKGIYKILILVGAVLFIGILFFILPNGKDGILHEVSIKEIESVSSANWRIFDYEDFNYSFRVPEKWIVARSFSSEGNSKLRDGEKKQSLAISKGENYIYFYPEGGFDSYIETRLKGDSLLENYHAKILNYDVSIDKYKKGHFFIKFLNFHDFVLEIFVDKGAENFENTCIEIENILKNMVIN